MSSISSGTLRYSGYKCEQKGKGPKNKRKSKLAKMRKEEAICLRIKKQEEEKLKNLKKTQYAKEAKEWESRYDF